ncbi:PPA1309 family protein [Saccharomonospora saliphila]|uniref:PPA1309 family protein n=1 Tax=Saccharomonospora saliphila TaxID=369829 RepID=UPI00037C9A6D|nr:PPA1309 family protein [Saccharomonospora saliphila]
MTESEDRASVARVAALAREVEEFVAAGGWDQPTQLFALVPTAEILREQPELAGQLDPDSEFTPVAQEELPEGDLAESLGRIAWPDVVRGCALAQEIVVLPPDAEDELPEVGDGGDEDLDRLRQAAADHPRRTEARLVAAVLRDGDAACVMRLRGVQPPRATEGPDEDGEPADDTTDELIEHPDLAPNLVEALRATLQP